MSGDDAEAQEALRRFGEAVEAHYAAGARGGMKSMLFNLQARTIVGSYCYLEHMPWFVRELRAAADPVEIGRRARRLGRFPTLMSLNSLPLGYFGGRAQRSLVDPAAEPTPAAEDADVLSFWMEVGEGYLGTDEKLPSDGGPMSIVDPPVVEMLGAEVDDDRAVDAAGVRRLLATLELYTYILTGESRVGVFNHGPYRLGEEMLLVKEYVGLGGSPLLWGEPLGAGVDAVIRVMRARPLRAGTGPFGNLEHTSDPVEEHLVREIVMVRREPEGEVERPTVGLLEALPARIADLQMDLYARVAGWDDDRRAGYGAHLYASIAEPFAALAGVDLGPEMADRFEQTAARRAPALISGAEKPWLLERLGTVAGGNPYSAIGER